MFSYMIFFISGISELSDISVPDDSQFAASRSNILQIQQQQQQQSAAPQSGSRAPQLVEAFHDTRVRQGDSVTLTCIITGNPKPRVSV